MRIRMSRWLGATVALAVLLGVMVVVPAWAAPSRQDDGPASAPYDAVHEGCATGDAESMEEHTGDGHHEAMDTHMPGEDWQAMEEHTGDGHHGAMGTGMMGTGGILRDGSEHGATGQV